MFVKALHLAPLLGLAVAAQAKSPTAAVFPLSSRGIDSNSTRILEEALANGLIKSGKLRLLERSQIATVLKEQGFQKSGACDGEQCAVQMGKLLGIEQGVVGSIGLLGKTWVLNTRVIDIRTGEVLKTSQRSTTGAIDKALVTAVPEAVADLTGSTAAASPAETAPAPQGSSKTWLWWTLGGAAIAGGSAALLLLGESKPSAGAAASPASVTFQWN